ncbi:MAG: hypothetical protein LIO77_08195 [Rikenellaceae bacterium]|nr:hypothetical protein [Rikenellaceae bacterium]
MAGGGAFLKRVTGLIPSLHTQWLDLNSHEPIVPEVIACFVSGDHRIASTVDDTSPGCAYPHSGFTGTKNLGESHPQTYLSPHDAALVAILHLDG